MESSKNTSSIWKHLSAVNKGSTSKANNMPDELIINNEHILDSNTIAFKLNEYCSSIANFLNRNSTALFCLSSRCLVIVVWLFLMIPRICLQFVIMVFPDHTHLLFRWNWTEDDKICSKLSLSSDCWFNKLKHKLWIVYESTEKC